MQYAIYEAGRAWNRAWNVGVAPPENVTVIVFRGPMLLKERSEQAREGKRNGMPY